LSLSPWELHGQCVGTIAPEITRDIDGMPAFVTLTVADLDCWYRDRHQQVDRQLEVLGSAERARLALT
jgi:hypothetical protein